MMNGSPVLGVFLDEALDGITTIVSCIKTGGEGASIDSAYRCAHSLVVNSRLLGFENTAASASAVEDTLLACRSTTSRLESGRAAALLVDLHALPTILREDLRPSFSPGSIERLDARIREMRALVDKAGRTEPAGNA
jgi:chemotaxis protein histidine kinase CheA